MVRPSIEYCSSVWDPHHQNHIDKLESIQHRGSRFVLNIPYKRNQGPNQIGAKTLMTRLNWPSLQNRRKHQRLIILYKIITEQIAIPLSYLPSKSNAQTRKQHSKKLIIPRSAIDVHKYSLIPRTTLD